MSLVRRLSLNSDNTLKMEPVSATQVLRSRVQFGERNASACQSGDSAGRYRR